MEVTLTFLADLPRYQVEKPFYALPRPTEEFLAKPPGEDFIPEHPLTNLEFDRHSNILIQNLRGHEKNFTIESNGFEILTHTSKIWENLNSPAALEAYRREIDDLLTQRFNALHTYTFEARVLLLFVQLAWPFTNYQKRRKNQPFKRQVYDLNDPMTMEGPAVGAHTDFTVESGPKTIDRYLSNEAKGIYLNQAGYRFRIINTWRSLLPILEDNPLAVCDTRTVDISDLVAADRVIPTRAGEVYYVKYNPNQRWYWLDKMSPAEPFGMVTYDSHSGGDANFCLHVSFPNPLAPKDAAPRCSIESRSIVVTRLDA